MQQEIGLSLVVLDIIVYIGNDLPVNQRRASGRGAISKILERRLKCLVTLS
jgi:hypothetical protein